MSNVLTDAASAEDLACSIRLSSAPKLGLNKKFASKVADTPHTSTATDKYIDDLHIIIQRLIFFVELLVHSQLLSDKQFSAKNK